MLSDISRPPCLAVDCKSLTANFSYVRTVCVVCTRHYAAVRSERVKTSRKRRVVVVSCYACVKRISPISRGTRGTCDAVVITSLRLAMSGQYCFLCASDEGVFLDVSTDNRDTFVDQLEICLSSKVLGILRNNLDRNERKVCCNEKKKKKNLKRSN